MGRRNPNTGMLFNPDEHKHDHEMEKHEEIGEEESLDDSQFLQQPNRRRESSYSIYETALQCFTKSALTGKGRVMKIREADQEKWGRVCCSSELWRIVFTDKTTGKPNVVCVCRCKSFFNFKF